MNKLNYLDIGAADFKLPQKWNFFENFIEPILFEPDERSYESLKKGGYKVFNVALGRKNGKTDFFLTKKPACSSIYRPNIEYLKTFPQLDRWEIIESINMEIVTLDSLKIDAHFIKMDTQGSELDILHGAAKTLETTLGLEIEVSFQSIYKNQPLFEDIKNFLKDFGFDFYDFVTEYRYNRLELNRTGQLAFADALFIKSPEHILSNNPDSVLLYNMICNVYSKYDLIIKSND